jgi:hypothetical protein
MVSAWWFIRTITGRAHVHVVGGGCEAVFQLNCPDGPLELRENYGFATRKLSKIKEALTAKLVI